MLVEVGGEFVCFQFDSSQTNSIAKLKIDNDYLRLRMQIKLKIASVLTLEIFAHLKNVLI